MRVPLEDDEAPEPNAAWPGETIESDAIPEPDPDTEEQTSTR